jgi:hypothetical protein
MVHTPAIADSMGAPESSDGVGELACEREVSPIVLGFFVTEVPASPALPKLPLPLSVIGAGFSAQAGTGVSATGAATAGGAGAPIVAGSAPPTAPLIVPEAAAGI